MAVDIAESRELKERVVEINRVAKVVKGGRRFSFTALVVIGDEVDRVGVGYGKAREVPARDLESRRRCEEEPLHSAQERADDHPRGARPLRRCPRAPAPRLAGNRRHRRHGCARSALLELGGIRDVLAKSLGTTNPINRLNAAESALRALRRPEEVALARRRVDPRQCAADPIPRGRGRAGRSRGRRRRR